MASNGTLARRSPSSSMLRRRPLILTPLVAQTPATSSLGPLQHPRTPMPEARPPLCRVL